MGVFSKNSEAVSSSHYDRAFWHDFRTHRMWVLQQQQKIEQNDRLAFLSCGGSAKICGHCRANDRMQGELFRQHGAKDGAMKEYAFKGMPFSKSFRRATIAKPKHSQCATAYERAMARMCNVEYKYIFYVTRSTFGKRSVMYDKVVQMARCNKQYKAYLCAVLPVKITPISKASKPKNNERPNIDHRSVIGSFAYVDSRRETHTPRLAQWSEEDTVKDTLARSGLNTTCTKFSGWSLPHLIYKQKFSISTVTKVLMYYKKSSNMIFNTYPGKTFAEIKHLEFVKRWLANVKLAAPNEEVAATWINKYYLKPVREILILAKSIETKKYTSMSDFNRKVKYFKDGGKLARSTEGQTFNEVKDAQIKFREEQRINNFFKDPTTTSRYPGKSINDIKLIQMKSKYPMLTECDSLSSMKEAISLHKGSEFLSKIRARYPGANISGCTVAQALKELDMYKQSSSYAVTAYFKDGGASARRYPGKTVLEIKAIRRQNRVNRAYARTQHVAVKKPCAYEKNAPRSVTIDLSSGEIAWDVAMKTDTTTLYSEVLPPQNNDVDFPRCQVPSLPPVRTHVSLAIKQVKKEPKVLEPVPYEEKTVIRNHVGPVPFWKYNKQLIQSYSVDVKASAGFARTSARRYPKEFRETLRAQTPQIGKAYTYDNIKNRKDICLMTKTVSTHPKSDLKDVEAALKEAGTICNKTIMMPRVETGCNKQQWKDIVPLIEKYFKGKTVNVYSNEPSENYGFEPYNGKHIVHGMKVNVVRICDVLAYCKHSINEPVVLGIERDLRVEGTSIEDFVSSVLNGQLDSAIKNRDGNKLKPGKSGILLKRIWTKNPNKIDWLFGPAGEYCMVSGIDKEGIIANALKVSKRVEKYYNPTDTANILFTEMSIFTADQQKVRNPIAGWCTNLNPSRDLIQPYHVHQDARGKCIVMSTHTCAPRLWMKMGFHVKMRGDKTFISTYQLDDPDTLWTTLPNLDNKFKYMREAEADVFEVSFLDRHTINYIKIGGTVVAPYGYSGMLINDKKTLQAVQDVGGGHYALSKVYKGHNLDLPILVEYGTIFTDAVLQMYNTESDVKTFAGGFSIHRQPPNYEEIGWFQTLGFSFNDSTFYYGSQKGKYIPCQDSEKSIITKATETVVGAASSALETVGLKEKKKPRPRRRSRSRSASRNRRVQQDERKRYQSERLVDDIVRMEARLKQLKIDVKKMNAPPRRNRNRKSRESKESAVTFGNKTIFVAIAFIFISFFITMTSGSPTIIPASPADTGVVYAGHLPHSETEKLNDQVLANLSVVTEKLDEEVEKLQMATALQSSAIKTGAISMAYIAEQIAIINEKNTETNIYLNECIDYLGITRRFARGAASMSARRAIHNLEKARRVRDMVLVQMDSMKATLNRSIAMIEILQGHVEEAVLILSEIRKEIVNNTEAYNQQTREVLDELASDGVSLADLTLNELDKRVSDTNKKLEAGLEAIRRDIQHPSLQTVTYTRLKRNAGDFSEKHCRIGAALGLKGEESCCFDKPDECEYMSEAETCVDTSEQKFLGRSTFGCQIAYSGMIVMKNGRMLVDMQKSTATRRCSMSCLTAPTLVNILQTQAARLSCFCGFQGILFKTEMVNETLTTDGTRDLRVYGSRTEYVSPTKSWTFINLIDFGKHCCRSGTMALDSNTSTYRDGYCMCRDKIKEHKKAASIKYSLMLQATIVWIGALYMCRAFKVDNLFLTLTLMVAGGAYYVKGECATDAFVVANPVGIKTTTAYLNIDQGTCFLIGNTLYEVEGIFTERLYTFKHNYVYEAYTECQGSQFECTGGIGDFCGKKTECKNRCEVVRGAYEIDCVERSDFDYGDCINISVNVRGEVCVAWKNETVVKHYEAASEAIDSYIKLRVDRGGRPSSITIHTGTDDNSETISLNTLVVTEAIVSENIYLLNQGIRCSGASPQEGEVCTVGGLSYDRMLNTECLEAEFNWKLEKKEFTIKFTKDQMKNWLEEYAAECSNVEITEQTNLTLRVKQRMGKARITLATYEDTSIRGTTSCKQVSDTRVKVDLGKGEWLATSRVVFGGRVENECILIVNVDPCTIIGPVRKIVKASFTWTLEVACGMRTANKLKIYGEDTLLTELKLPKLYTDVNYDITYGVQTLQVLASRVGDVFGNTGDYASFGNAFTVFSKDMIKTLVKVMIYFLVTYVFFYLIKQ